MCVDAGPHRARQQERNADAQVPQVLREERAPQPGYPAREDGVQPAGSGAGSAARRYEGGEQRHGEPHSLGHRLGQAAVLVQRLVRVHRAAQRCRAGADVSAMRESR
eukprot:5197010-Pyramimonas_sp.AAC.1